MAYKQSIIILFIGISLLFSNQTLIDLPADTWYEVPNTHMIDVMRTDMGARENLINAWSGGVYDPIGKRLLVWGGGMGNYKGNEFYAFYIDDLRWERLNEPCVNYGCCDPDPCGTAMVRHTYGGMAFLTHANRFFVNGGAKNCGSSKTCPNGRTMEGTGLNLTWTFNMANKTWEQKNPNGPGRYMQTCAYNALTGRVYYASLAGTHYYDYDTDTWTQISPARSTGSQGSLVDPKRRWFARLGADGSVWDHEVCTHDLTSPAYTKTNYMTSGSNNIISSNGPGVEYDPVADKYVCWRQGSVYSLNPDSWQWSQHSGSGAPPTTSNGVYGRWRYVPHVNAYICVTGAGINVHFYKFTAGGPPSTREETGQVVGNGRDLVLKVSPNPFDSRTVIRITRSRKTEDRRQIAEIKILNITGKIVYHLASDLCHLTSGLSWNAAPHPPGIYLIKVKSGNHTLTKQAILLK